MNVAQLFARMLRPIREAYIVVNTAGTAGIGQKVLSAGRLQLSVMACLTSFAAVRTL